MTLIKGQRISRMQRFFLKRHTLHLFGYSLTIYDLWAEKFCWELFKRIKHTNN